MYKYISSKLKKRAIAARDDGPRDRIEVRGRRTRKRVRNGK